MFQINVIFAVSVSVCFVEEGDAGDGAGRPDFFSSVDLLRKRIFVKAVTGELVVVIFIYAHLQSWVKTSLKLMVIVNWESIRIGG